MKVTVTVELDEGVKVSSSSDTPTEVVMEMGDGKRQRITTEAILVENVIPRFSDDIDIKEVLNIEPKLLELSSTHGRLAMEKILAYFNNHNRLLLQRVKNGVREVHKVEDIDVALKWLSEGNPDAQS